MKVRPVKLSFSVGFQIKYCLAIIAIFTVANGLLYLLMNKALSGGYRENLRTLYYLDQHLSTYLSIMALLLMLFILILTLVVTLLVSHQIAGPVFRYEDVLKKIISGDLPQKVATRESDQLKPLVSSLNALTARCRNTFEAAQKLSDSVAVQLEGSPAQEKMDNLLQQIADMRGQMGDFKSGRGPE